MEYNNELFITNTYEIANAQMDGDFLNIEGYCCHFNTTNLNNQVVDEKSFNYFFGLYNQGKLKPALTYEHGQDVLGGIDLIEKRENGLWMKARLNKNVKLNNEMIIPNVLAGDIKSFSTEGYVLNGYDGVVELKDGYYIKDFVLTAVSVVRTPADWDAVFGLANFLQGYKEWKAEQPKVQAFNKLLMLL